VAGRVPGHPEAQAAVSSLRFMEGQQPWTAAHWLISSMRPGTVARVPGENGAGCLTKKAPTDAWITVEAKNETRSLRTLFIGSFRGAIRIPGAEWFFGSCKS
jgi:hypothetical protein